MKNFTYEEMPKRDILCIDCKSFFASVESVRRGEHPLESLVVVMSRGDSAGGLVLASSPRAKAEYGIKTGTRRYEIQPEWPVTIVEPRMNDYIKMNLKVNTILKRYTDDINWFPYSIDESFIDVTHSHTLFGTTLEIARAIQTTIFKELGLVVCVGIGDNPLLAKLALDHEAKEKYPYLAYWSYQDIAKIWAIHPLSAMWGIGHRTERTLQKMGIFTVKALAETDVASLQKKLGIIGEQLYYHAHGIDYSILAERIQPVSTSYGTSQILERDYHNPTEVLVVIREMVDKVATRLRKHQRDCEVLHLAINYSKGSEVASFSIQRKINATSSTTKLQVVAVKLFEDNYQEGPVRRISISCGKTAAKKTSQLNLFEIIEETVANERLERTIDLIRERYGYRALIHASSLSEGATAIKRSRLVGGH